MDASLDAIAGALRGLQRVLILTHRNPDGDAIGSATALAAGLRWLGSVPTVVCPDPLPPSLLGIPDAAQIRHTLDLMEWDIAVAVDVSDPQLLQPLAAASPAFFATGVSINLDHHVSNLRYAAINHVDPSAASATEIVFALLEALSVPLSRELATQLLFGIVNDTHSFQNRNTSPRTLRISAALVEAGADLSGIVFDLLLARSAASARLWSRVLPSLEFGDGGRVATMVVSTEALRHACAELSDADGMVEFLKNIRHVDLAVLYKQVDAQAFRMSMRTTEAVDATVVAGSFGGGGHRRAAGCDASGALEEIRARVLAAYHAARVE